MAKQVQAHVAERPLAWDEPSGNGREMVSLSNLIAEVKDQQPEVVSRLVDVWERVRNIEREEAFNQAFAEMWPKLPQIARKGEASLGTKGSYKYVRDEDLMDECAPLMDTHGFGYSVRTVAQDLDAKPLPTLTMEGELIYKKNGYSKKNRMTGTYDRGPGRNELQALGSCQTYLIKYIVRALLAIVQKGADDDGKLAHGTGDRGASPPPPPRPRERPADRPIGKTEWVRTAARSIDLEMDEHEHGRWWRYIQKAYERAPSLEDLNDLEAVLRCDIEHPDTPSDVRTDLNVRLLEARKKFAERPAFEYFLFDAQGNETADLHLSPLAWATAFMTMWGKANQVEREALLEHNADALEDAKATGLPAIVKLLADAVIEPETSGHYEEVLATDAMFDEPEPDPDEVWADAQLDAIAKMPKSINGRATFDALVVEIRPRMKELRTAKPAVYSRVSEAFTRRHAELPGGSK